MIIQFIKGHKKFPSFFGRKIAQIKSREEELKASLIINGDECDVPKGYLAVYVGFEMMRFVIPTAYLRLPEFRDVLEKAEKEFGYSQKGGLMIPCEVEDFEEKLRVLDEVERSARGGKNKARDFGSKRSRSSIMVDSWNSL